ncbi:TetR/AcrR family transcriptional regulator [Sporomusa sp.]|uniref:TetR/AcrR family transcriptional regulator n=1 Tax=Sporomusa sp. TaxID=2078658 RepID=UPI002B847955|nr:TetR/AcrR family transcriptional regulator [Sporomusa sp.]HWR06934.1 TetR/AcrR family transcriptional regulator [Sporomusa sp.]HWR42320.1 TetR/AcrR family transcriptional regulator [Sporomusa sp.]
MVSSQTKVKIKNIALSLFANNGYDATSMEKIAAGVGIKKSSLYAFITSKEALFWEIYEDLESQYHNYMEQVLSESENMLPPERLYYLFKKYLMGTQNTSNQEGPAARTFWIRVMFFPPVALKDRLLTRALNHEMGLGERYKEIIQDGIRQGLIQKDPPEEILLSYYSLRQGLYSLMNVFMSDLTEDQKLDKIDKVWRKYWQGIKGR